MIDKKQKQYQRKYLEKNRALWKVYLTGIKKNPFCQICKKKLEYFNCIRSSTVHFDHRSINLNIKGPPSDWLKANPPTERNKRIWKQCDFGILCNKCNRFLITKNRKKWIINVVKYIFSKKDRAG